MSEHSDIQTPNPTRAVGPDGFLTAAAVAALQTRFLERVEARVDGAMLQLELTDPLLRAAAIDGVLCAERCNLPMGNEQLHYLLQNGVEAFAEREEILLEEISKYEFKPHIRAALDAAAGKRVEDAGIKKFFNSRDRLYMPFDDNVNLDSHTRLGVEHVLRTRGYQVTDYKAGYATGAEDGKQTYKIGRLLRKMGADFLLKSFMEDAARYDTQKFFVVLSRDVVDIERMSTNRNWRSCLSHDGDNIDSLHKEIENGTLVTYLVSENDPEINNPLGRILLKPYLRDELPLSKNFFAVVRGLLSSKGGNEILYIPDKLFGLENDAFERAVVQVSQKLNAGKTGTFSMSPDVYAEQKAWPTVGYDGARAEVLKVTKHLDP